MTNEKIIEEAAQRLNTFLRLRDGTSGHDKDLRIVLDAVFEKALGEATVTPTADEREALVDVIRRSVAGTHGIQAYLAGVFADAVLRAGFRRSEVTEPSAEGPGSETLGKTPVRFVARQGGKSQATIDALLAQANEHGIRVEVIYPQSEPSDKQVRSALSAWFQRMIAGGWDNTHEERMRAALRAAFNVDNRTE